MYAIRIIYPGRRGRAGKRDLVKKARDARSAHAYAKKVAARAGRGAMLMGGRSGAVPTACVYNLKAWDAKPACYRVARGESIYGEKRGGNWTVRQVPYTALGAFGSPKGRRHRGYKRRGRRLGR